MREQEFRIETDSMGEVMVPAKAYYGAQTQRAVENFPISRLRFPRVFIWALGLIKLVAARTNLGLGLLSEEIAVAIIQAAKEVADGGLDNQFVVDIFQTGSGTSINMNADEVIANRAIEILGGTLGSKNPVHPNDHVNLSQSSNDVIPTVIHLAAVQGIQELLLILKECGRALAVKSEQFDDIVKIGRTHLMDAVPMTLGQEFSGYAYQVFQSCEQIKRSQTMLMELALGGTAVGTGFGAPTSFAGQTIALLVRETGFPFREARNHFAAQGAQGALVSASATLKGLALTLFKIGNDLRWLSSGPQAGLGEICLPAVQPGSSIMPGKVNPVIVESLLQVAVQVQANDLAVSLASQAGNFELNTMLPIMAYSLLQSVELLKNAVSNFTKKCLKGITANEAHCRELAENSLALVTALAPKIGYDKAAQLAQQAAESGRSILAVALEEQVLPEEELRQLLNPTAMT